MKSERGKLLVVEDEEMFRHSLLNQLKSRLDIDIVEATTGKHALDVIEKEKPDAILTDIMMPDMNGIQLIRAVRELGYDTPFLVLTGQGTQDDLLRAMRLGAKDFIEKPCDFDKLTKKVKATVEFGTLVKQVYRELDALCDRSNLEGEELREYRERTRELLLKQKMSWLSNDDDQ